MSSRGGRRGGSARGGGGGRDASGNGNAAGNKRSNNNPSQGHPSKRGGAGGGDRGGSDRGGSRGGYRGGRGRNFSNRGGFGGGGQAFVTVTVSGFPARSVNPNSLTSQLAKMIRSRPGGENYQVPRGKMSKNQEACFFNFKDRDSALPLLQLNGIEINGARISIVERGGSIGGKPLNEDAKNRVLDAIGRRYNAESKFLDLEGLCVQCSLSFDNALFANYVFDIIREYCSDLTTLSLKGNGISSLSNFVGLASAAPNLQNLSFEENNIFNLQELSNLSGLQNLQQVIFSANPVCNTDPSSYLAYLQFKFPCIQYIDHIPVPRFIQFDLPDHATSGYIPSSRSSYFMNEMCESFAMDFVPKFFESFDSDQRADYLVDAYLPDSTFSITVAAGESIDGYSLVDRNLKVLDEFESKSADLLVKGKVGISSFFKNMPRTKHNVNELLADVVLIPVGDTSLLMVTTHGQYMEQILLNDGTESTETRYFDRVFTLAAANGANLFNCFVINDQLHVSSLDTGRSASHVSSIDSDGMEMSEEELKSLAIQIAKHAGVTPEVAYGYLTRNGNDPNAALAQIQGIKMS